MYVTLMRINPTVGANQTSRFYQLGILSSGLNVLGVHTYHTVSSDSWLYEGSVSLCLPGLFTKPLSHITHYTQVWIIW